VPSQTIIYKDASGAVLASVTAHKGLFGGAITFDVQMPTKTVAGLSEQQFSEIIYPALEEWEHET
jgi:hypothetical protein